MSKKSNAKRNNTNQKAPQTQADDEWGTMRNDAANDNTLSNQAENEVRMARAVRSDYGTTPPQNYSNRGNMDADPRQASRANAKASKNNSGRSNTR